MLPFLYGIIHTYINFIFSRTQSYLPALSADVCTVETSSNERIGAQETPSENPTSENKASEPTTSADYAALDRKLESLILSVEVSHNCKLTF